MRIKYVIITGLILLFMMSCSSTGILGLATEEGVIEMNQKKDQEISEIKAEIKEINKLVDQLEIVLEEAKSAKANAKEALIISRETAAESLKLSQKIESVKELLQEIEGKIESMPKESIEKLIEILQVYVKEKEET